MLHTSRFPHAQCNAREWDDRDRRLARFTQWRCNWEPGTKYEYHPTSAHWVLAEIITEVSGEDYRSFIRSRIIDPLGLTKLRLGVPPDEQGDIAEIALVGEPSPREELARDRGIRD